MTTPNIRTIARQRGIDLASLIQILSVRRPADSDLENKFVMHFIDPIPGMMNDDYGNRYVTLGDNPKVMWSCHTDTVSSDEGLQNVRWKGDTLELNHPRVGQTLGADDGAGIWLMLEMIKAGKPGLYIFHRDEEIGGLGSKHIAKSNPDIVAGIEMAIAFDRKATHSVITYQRGKRCCSDAFGNALAAALNTIPDLAYKLDEGGVFTDTASYTSIIPECTNLSAGYYDEHTSRETLDVAHLVRLRDAVLALDPSILPVERDPTVVESRYSGYGYGYGDYDHFDHWYGNTHQGAMGNGHILKSEASQIDPIEELVRSYPASVARWLAKTGLTVDELTELIWPCVQKPLELVDEAGEGPDDDIIEMEVLCCDHCGECTPDGWLRNGANEGDPCDNCGSKETTVEIYMVNQFSGEIHEYA